MANFRTHLAVGTMATGLLATMAMAASVVNTNQVIMLTCAGAFGSVLPDIDLERSKSSRAIFFGLALFLSFCVLFAVGDKFSILEMWLLWLGVFLGIRYFGQALFHKFAVHRGIFHSLLAGVFFMFATAAIFRHIYQTTEFISWMAGLFVLFGYIVHLVLDEVYSVDFDNTRIKKSFGTALKIFEYRSLGASLAMAFATIAIYYLTPSYESLATIFTSEKEWTQIWHKLLPAGSPFGIDEILKDVASSFNADPSQASEGGQATGSIESSQE
ncbi:MAG: metal-dependent hydrolase [Methyloligellaceae bacterium]